MKTVENFLKKINKIPLFIRLLIVGAGVFGMCFSSSFIFTNPIQATTASINRLISDSNDNIAFSSISSTSLQKEQTNSFYYDYLKMTSIRDTSNVRQYNQGHISKVVTKNEIETISIEDSQFDGYYIVSTPIGYSNRNDEFYFTCEALTKYKFYTYNNQINSCAIHKSLADKVVEDGNYDTLISKDLTIKTTFGVFVFSIQCVFDGEDSFCGTNSIIIKDSNSTNSIFADNYVDMYLDLVKAEKCVSYYISFVVNNELSDTELIINHNRDNEKVFKTTALYDEYCQHNSLFLNWFIQVLIILVSAIVIFVFDFYFFFAKKMNNGTYKNTIFLLFYYLVIILACSHISLNSYFVYMPLMMLFSYSSIPVLVFIMLLFLLKIIFIHRSKKIE